MHTDYKVSVQLGILNKEEMKYMNILIINGHWSNRGDESAIRAMIDALHNEYPNANIFVQLYCSNVVNFPQIDNVKNIEIKYPRKRAIFEYPIVFLTRGKVSFLKSTKDFVKLLSNINLVIHAPGGPSIGDLYKHVEYLYLMKLLLIHRLGIPYVFYAPSMGPFKDRTRNIIRKYILENSSLLCVRESLSAEYLKGLKLKQQVYVTMDSAIQSIIKEQDYMTILKSYTALDDFMNKYNKIVGITITELDWHPVYKNDMNVKNNIKNSFTHLIQYLDKEGYGILFIPQLFGEQNDSNLMLNYAKLSNNTFVIRDEYDCYFQQYIIGRLYAVIGLRYHSNIFSAKMGTPFISVSYEQKMSGFMNIMNIENYCIDIKSLSDSNLLNKFKQLVENYSEYKSELNKSRKFMYEKSSATTELTCKVIESVEIRDSSL